jgi:hypothetical protein
MDIELCLYIRPFPRTRRNFLRGAEFRFACFVISRVELIRKDKEKFRSARKIPPSGKRPIDSCRLGEIKLPENTSEGYVQLPSENTSLYFSSSCIS